MYLEGNRPEYINCYRGRSWWPNWGFFSYVCLFFSNFSAIYLHYFAIINICAFLLLCKWTCTKLDSLLSLLKLTSLNSFCNLPKTLSHLLSPSCLIHLTLPFYHCQCQVYHFITSLRVLVTLCPDCSTSPLTNILIRTSNPTLDSPQVHFTFHCQVNPLEAKIIICCCLVPRPWRTF